LHGGDKLAEEMMRAIGFALEASLVKMHTFVCPECKKKYNEIREHLRETAKDEKNKEYY